MKDPYQRFADQTNMIIGKWTEEGLIEDKIMPYEVYIELLEKTMKVEEKDILPTMYDFIKNWEKK
jgi:hypothetical protein